MKVSLAIYNIVILVLFRADWAMYFPALLTGRIFLSNTPRYFKTCSPKEVHYTTESNVSYRLDLKLFKLINKYIYIRFLLIIFIFVLGWGLSDSCITMELAVVLPGPPLCHAQTSSGTKSGIF